MLLKSYLSKTAKSQAQFAREVNCTRAAVGHWLTGIRLPSLAQVEAIERATNGKVTRRDLRPEWFARRAA